MRVVVIGAGITGCSAALMLARRGARVTLVDQATRPFSGASRWNEGKIHLGYLYAADPSLPTARRLLPGGLAFRPLVEELLSSSLQPVTTQEDDLYLVHRDSVVDVTAMRRHVAAVTSMAASHAAGHGYLTSLREDGSRELCRDELPFHVTDEIAAGFLVPERSVLTQWVADRFVQAVMASDIQYLGSTHVTGVRSIRGSSAPPYRLRARAGWLRSHLARPLRRGGQRCLGRAPGPGRLPRASPSRGPQPSVPPRCVRADTVEACSPAQHRRQHGTVRRRQELQRARLLPLLVSGRTRCRRGGCLSTAGSTPPDADRQAVIDGTVGRLRDLGLGVDALMTDADEVDVEGGWVYAAGRGSLSDPRPRCTAGSEWVRHASRPTSLSTQGSSRSGRGWRASWSSR